MDGVHERLDRIEALINDLTVSQVMEEETMSLVSEKVAQALAEVEELSTVTDGIVAWNANQTALLADLRQQLADKGVSDADLASLDEVIAMTDAQTGRLAEVLTSNTDAEGEEPESPVPTSPPVDVPAPSDSGTTETGEATGTPTTPPV